MIGADGENVGVVSLRDALKKASLANLDLVEISANAKPPVAKITDYGKYQYEQNKLKKEYAKRDKEKGKKASEETKNIQIKPATSGTILEHRAEKVRKWLENGNKVTVDLFLFGRYKAMDEKFLKSKLETFLELVGTDAKGDGIKKSAKGFSITLQIDMKL